MSTLTNLSVSDIVPSLDAVLQLQGIPPGAEIQSRVINSAKKALQLFTDLAAPKAIAARIEHEEFESIFQGIGLNNNPNPIENVFQKSRFMAMFAATIGPAIGHKIKELFAEGEFALGSLLDSAASNGTDLISHFLENSVKEDLIRHGRIDSEAVVMAYSPGYCGWHVSAQKKLFEFLRPEKIGITLRDSFLMEPLKSISGVLLAGPRNIHIYDDSFPCCAECKSHTCRDRISALEMD